MSPHEPPAPVRLRGIASFLGRPIGDLEDLRPGDVAMVGLFHDHDDFIGFGARFAARQIRYASRPAYGLVDSDRTAPTADADAAGRVFDLGDLNVFPLERPRHCAVLQGQLAAMLAVGARVVVVGGSMSLHEVVAAAMGPPMAAPSLPSLRIGAPSRCGAPSGVFGAVPDQRGALGAAFLEVDLGGLFDPAAGRHAASGLLAALGALSMRQVRVAHLTGFAPELDLSARHETALAARILQKLVQAMVRGVRDALAP
jgi:hypothetical protein